MKEDEIIEMARQAGMAYEDKLEVYVANIDDLQDFAKLVAEKEREACAKYVESFMIGETPLTVVMGAIGDAIQARGQA